MSRRGRSYGVSLSVARPLISRGWICAYAKTEFCQLQHAMLLHRVPYRKRHARGVRMNTITRAYLTRACGLFSDNISADNCALSVSCAKRHGEPYKNEKWAGNIFIIKWCNLFCCLTCVTTNYLLYFFLWLLFFCQTHFSAILSRAIMPCTKKKGPFWNTRSSFFLFIHCTKSHLLKRGFHYSSKTGGGPFSFWITLFFRLKCKISVSEYSDVAKTKSFSE